MYSCRRILPLDPQSSHQPPIDAKARSDSNTRKAVACSLRAHALVCAWTQCQLGAGAIASRLQHYAHQRARQRKGGLSIPVLAGTAKPWPSMNWLHAGDSPSAIATTPRTRRPVRWHRRQKGAAVCTHHRNRLPTLAPPPPPQLPAACLVVTKRKSKGKGEHEGGAKRGGAVDPQTPRQQIPTASLPPAPMATTTKTGTAMMMRVLSMPGVQPLPALPRLPARSGTAPAPAARLPRRPASSSIPTRRRQRQH